MKLSAHRSDASVSQSSSQSRSRQDNSQHYQSLQSSYQLTQPFLLIPTQRFNLNTHQRCLPSSPARAAAVPARIRSTATSSPSTHTTSRRTRGTPHKRAAAARLALLDPHHQVRNWLQRRSPNVRRVSLQRTHRAVSGSWHELTFPYSGHEEQHKDVLKVDGGTVDREFFYHEESDGTTDILRRLAL